MIPLFQIFGTKMFKKMLILECLGCFTKSIVVSILDFWHISFKKMFKLLACKRNHNFFESRASCKTIKIVIMACGSLTFSLSVFFEEKSPYRVGRHVENVFYLKDFVTWQVCEMLSDVSLGGVFMLLMQLPRWSPCRLIFNHMDRFRTGRFLKTH